MDGSPEGGADQDPKGPREIAELGGENGADQGAGSGNGRKVMAEDDPAVRGDEVLPIRMEGGSRLSLLIQRQDIRKQPCGMESVGEREGADPGHHDPEGIDRFTPDKGDRGNGEKQEEGDPSPDEC